MSEPMLTVRRLSVETTAGQGVLLDVDLDLHEGEILGLVGESGSGKTTTALSLLGWTERGLRRTSGIIEIAGEAVDPSSGHSPVRGRLVTYVPQNPGTALNPSLRIAAAVRDMIDAHASGQAGSSEPLTLLGTVGLPATPQFGKRYKHQLSGGQQQRVCIAVSLASGAPVVVLDEPTTGLDVVTQAMVLEELQRLRAERGIAMVYVSHDLSVVAQLADRVAVMYAGRIVELGTAEQVLTRPVHPYTKGLIASIPDHLSPGLPRAMAGIASGVGDPHSGCSFSPRCPLRRDTCDATVPELEKIAPSHQVRCFEHERSVGLPLLGTKTVSPEFASAVDSPVLTVARLRAVYGSRSTEVVAASDVSFDIHAGTCVALVGESGSGKTTIARAIAGLHPQAEGRVELHGELLDFAAARRSVEVRRRIQMVFQNPSEALNPRQTVRTAIARPLGQLRGLKGSARDAEVERLLDSVRLPARVADRYPRELSGGERQRVSIARALAAQPELLVCDEITSALDVSVQAAVLELLDELRTSLGLAVLFITHDLGVVAAIADTVLVLEAGLVCEQGPTREVLTHPEHPYTRRLLESAPSLRAAAEGSARVSAVLTEAPLIATTPGQI